jgi:TatD DNase family protein
MIDVHCHLNFHSFETDYDLVIKKAFEDGVEKIINVGTKIDSSQKAIDLANQYKNLYAIVGVHPHHADKVDQDWISELEKLAKQPKVVAIGECGLDYFEYRSNGIVDPKLQREVFIKQIELSIKLKLPLQIHNRHAGRDVTDILENYKNDLLELPGMFHCFSGGIEHLKKVLELGFYVGFDGNITYKGIPKGEPVELSELVKYAPVDRIVTETDAPFLTPQPHRGERNIPSYVIIVGSSVAKIKGLPEETVRQQTIRNAVSLFRLN